jgi:RNA polymerase sigma-70 factor, ECF subfamily
MVGVMVAWAVASEQEVLARAQAGDESAFEELIGLTQGKLFGLAARLLGSRVEAQDVLQEAYLAAYTHLDQLDPSRSPMGWLTTVVTRLCLNRLRSGKRQSGTTLDSLGELLGHCPSPDAQIHLQQALATLNDEFRAVILLHYWGGYSCKEMSAMLECSESSIKVKLFRARERLRTCL